MFFHYMEEILLDERLKGILGELKAFYGITIPILSKLRMIVLLLIRLYED